MFRNDANEQKCETAGGIFGTPGDDFKCLICLDILQERHLTTCCGNHHLCKVCMDTVKKANGKCPLCQKKLFNGFIDKLFEIKTTT